MEKLEQAKSEKTSALETAHGEFSQQLSALAERSALQVGVQLSAAREKASKDMVDALRRARHSWEQAQAKLLAELESRAEFMVEEARAEVKAEVEAAEEKRSQEQVAEARKSFEAELARAKQATKRAEGNMRSEQRRAKGVEALLAETKEALERSREKEAAAKQQFEEINESLNRAATERLLEVSFP